MTSIHEREKSRLQHGVVWPLTLETRKWPVSSSRTLGVWPQFFFSFWHSECDLSKVVCTVFSHSNFFFWHSEDDLSKVVCTVFLHSKKGQGTEGSDVWECLYVAPRKFALVWRGFWRVSPPLGSVGMTSPSRACLEGFLTNFSRPTTTSCRKLRGVCVRERERERVCVCMKLFFPRPTTTSSRKLRGEAAVCPPMAIYIYVYMCVCCVYMCVCVCVCIQELCLRTLRTLLTLLTNLRTQPADEPLATQPPH